VSPDLKLKGESGVVAVNAACLVSLIQAPCNLIRSMFRACLNAWTEKDLSVDDRDLFRVADAVLQGVKIPVRGLQFKSGGKDVRAILTASSIQGMIVAYNSEAGSVGHQSMESVLEELNLDYAAVKNKERLLDHPPKNGQHLQATIDKVYLGTHLVFIACGWKTKMQEPWKLIPVTVWSTLLDQMVAWFNVLYAAPDLNDYHREVIYYCIFLSCCHYTKLSIVYTATLRICITIVWYVMFPLC
jgi:hypothetical protein